MNLHEIKSVYFIGIGGIGVSAIARLFLLLGKKVAGSDRIASDTTAKLSELGANIFIGHSKDNIKSLPDIAIFSEDISPDSQGFIELSYLRSKNVARLSYSKALGMFMEDQFGIGVTGTNGKSTTAAMLSLMLDRAGFDPTVVLGTKLSSINENSNFAANARLGRSKYMVVEADEYYRHMLDHKPSMIVLTNVAQDHLDYYKDLEEIKQAFTQYVQSLPENGIVIYNADDNDAVDVGRRAKCHKFTFGIIHYADLQAMNIKVESAKQVFDLYYKDTHVGNFELNVPGQFNIYNALGASLAALRLGVDIEVIRKTLKEYAGAWRRFETIGQIGSTTIISDYGHHPAAVSQTIAAAKEFYPGKKILLVFQPHQRNRTKKLFGEFIEALRSAEHVLMLEIFDVAGREHGEDVSSSKIVEELVKLGVDAKFVGSLQESGAEIKQILSQYDLAIFMGAGDIDQLARKICRQ